MKRLSQNSKYFFGVIGLGIIVMLVFGFNNRISAMRHLSDQADQVETQVKELEQTQMILETQIAYATSDAAAEEWAYEDARWVRDGDVPIAPISPRDSTPVPQTIEIPYQDTAENWEIWRALFFDFPSP